MINELNPSLSPTYIKYVVHNNNAFKHFTIFLTLDERKKNVIRLITPQ